MAFQEIVDMVLNPVFGWLLDIPPILAIIFLSLLLGLVSTILQKYMTNQAKMRRLKDDTKKLQKQMKEYQKKGEQEKMMKVQQKMMPIQMDLMKESFRPLIVTMLPFLVIFFWLSHHFAFYPIMPAEQFTVSAIFDESASGQATLVSDTLTFEQPTQAIAENTITWVTQGDAGTHTLTLQYAGAEFTRDVLITTERSYISPELPLDGPVEKFNVGNKKLLPLGDGFALFGWKPGWIFYYILCSIPISLGLKKLLNVV